MEDVRKKYSFLEESTSNISEGERANIDKEASEDKGKVKHILTKFSDSDQICNLNINSKVPETVVCDVGK